MKLNLKRPIIFFDLETTGVDTAKDRIVEISMAKIMPDGEEIVKTRKLNPEMHIPEEATAIHGITDEDVKDCPTFAQVAKSLEQFIRGCDFGGFNSNRFDLPVLVEEFLRAGVDVDFKRRKFIDVQNIFHKKEQRTLVAAYKFYCDKDLDDAHSAEADTLATYEVLKAQLERYPDLENDIDKLAEFSTRAETADYAGRILFNEKRRGGLRIRQIQGPQRGGGLPHGTELLRMDDERRFPALHQEGHHRNPHARKTEMTMKRLCATVLLLLLSVCAFAVQKSGTIVYINGSKFYIHTVQPGETLYGLSKAYEVGEKVILQYNPSAGGGLKAGENVKIPFVTAVPEPKSERKLRRTFDSHTVAQGETLYAISRKYEIPIQTVIEDNPNLDPTNLRLGERILIRKKEIGSEDEAGAKEQWEAYRNTLNSVAEEGYAYHMVKPGETFYSLSRRFGITEEQLGTLNGGLKPADLKAGAIIKVPGSPEELAAGERQPADTVRADSVPDLSADNRVKEIEFRALRRSATLDVALLLPMDAGTPNPSYLEFYQGFLLGLDSVKTKSGYSMNVCLYNTARDAEKIREITESDAFRNTDLIIGPVYEEGLYPVIRFAEEHNVPVVSPLANITGMNSDVLFQMAPDPAHKWEKAAELVNGDRQVTLIYTESTDKEFEKEILTLLGDSDYKKHTYKYVHPSARTNSNSGDLTPLLDNGADNVFIVMSDNEVDVDRILAAIASADTNISSRGRTAPRFVVLGNTRWNRMNNIDRTMFFKDRVIFISTYHAKRDSQTILDFDSAYIRSFGSLPTLFSYRGYDAAVIFCPAMYNDIEYDMEGRSYAPLQTSYLFGQGEERHNHVNRSWMRVNYNSDFTITVE